MDITLPQMQERLVLEHEHLQDLFEILTSKGYQVVGPTVRDHAIIYDSLTSVTDLPIGYTFLEKIPLSSCNETLASQATRK